MMFRAGRFKIDIDYFKDLDMNKTAEEKIAELDEDYYLEGTSFDTEVLIHNEVLLIYLMKVLFAVKNCKRNLHRCGAKIWEDDAELDPRMSKIFIFNQFKEVNHAICLIREELGRCQPKP